MPDGPDIEGAGSAENKGPRPFKEAYPDLDPQEVRTLMGLPLFDAREGARALHGILGRMMHTGEEPEGTNSGGTELTGPEEPSSVRDAIGQAGRIYAAIGEQFGLLGYTGEQLTAADKIRSGAVVLPPLDPKEPD